MLRHMGRTCLGRAKVRGRAGAGHEHHHHTHASGRRRPPQARLALALILGFMVVEVVVGIPADSLALLSDAAHMLTDAGALVLSLVAIRLAAPPGPGRYHVRPQARRDPLRALNGFTLLVLAG